MTVDDATFKKMVRFFYEEKDDPKRWDGWNAERCKRLMPMFFEALQQRVIYEKLALIAVELEAPDDGS